MQKNGFTFISIHSSDKLISGIWNPYNYKYCQDESLIPFADFAKIIKVSGNKKEVKYLDFEPIEYKHIPKGDMLTFNLKEKSEKLKGAYSLVEENTLLFGTMRAYLGNACVTPLSNWINLRKKYKIAVNSEFVKILPFDNYKYFWWAFVKSNSFLKEMPTGSGGTRPRVNPELLGNIRVQVPNNEERKKINESLKSLVKKAWFNYIQSKELLKNLK